MAIDHKKWPELKKAWDAYGHGTPFENLLGVKSDRGCYCVVYWKNDDGTITLADLARGAGSLPWEMQNDGIEGDNGPLTVADWGKLRIIPECDWFEIPGKVKAL